MSDRLPRASLRWSAGPAHPSPLRRSLSPPWAQGLPRACRGLAWGSHRACLWACRGVARQVITESAFGMREGWEASLSLASRRHDPMRRSLIPRGPSLPSLLHTFSSWCEATILASSACGPPRLGGLPWAAQCHRRRGGAGPAGPGWLAHSSAGQMAGRDEADGIALLCFFN